MSPLCSAANNVSPFSFTNELCIVKVRRGETCNLLLTGPLNSSYDELSYSIDTFLQSITRSFIIETLLCLLCSTIGFKAGAVYRFSGTTLQ